MKPTPEQLKALANFPAALRALVEAELAAGNSIIQIENGFPAAPCGASIKLKRRVSITRRKSTNEIYFYDRDNPSYAGEFTTAERHFFVLEPPLPEPPPPDMDAIRKALEPKADLLSARSQRDARAPISVEAKSTQTPAHFTSSESPTGWTRLLYFCDKRPPHLVQFELEREFMVLFIASMDGQQLKMLATAHVNGAQYDLELRFIAALKSSYYFSLNIIASWADSASMYHDYFRKTSDSWYKLWTRDLVAATPPDMRDNLVERYQNECKTTLHAEQHLGSVNAVQRAIVDGMKQGGKFGTSHKEGGTDIYWRDHHFVRSDYGDYPDSKTYNSEAEFFQMLWNFCQFDVTRNAGKQGFSELDTWKLILRRMSPVKPPHPEDLLGGFSAIAMTTFSPTLTVTTMMPLYSSPFAKWLTLGVLALIFASIAAWQLVSIKSTGTPLGPALRSATHVFQLIDTQERYLPSLHRNASKNRFSIDLLVIPIADPSKQEIFKLIRQQQSNALTPMTKILGVDGDVVWIQALDTFAVNLRTKRVANESDLRKANPELALFLQSAKPEFTDRFLAISPDWHQAYAFSGETLKASSHQPPPRDSWLDEQRSSRVENSLCSGGLISASEWISIATPEEARNNFKIGFSLPRDFSSHEKNQQFQLYRGTTDTSESRPKILQFSRVSETEFRAANFLRTHPNDAILHANNPDSVFLLHQSGPQLFAPFSLTRLTPDGKIIWSTSTGIGRLSQTLPSTDVIALLGETPQVENIVSEPLLVLINVASGKAKTVILWQR